MKKILFIATILLAGCAPARTYSPVPVESGSTPPPAETRTIPSATDTRTPAPNTLSRDASDCERQAALSCRPTPNPSSRESRIEAKLAIWSVSENAKASAAGMVKMPSARMQAS